MIDVHSHLLYGLDDGSPSLESSLAMLKAAAADGITTVITTPHYSPEIAEKVQLQLEELRPEAAKSGITLFAGCEYDFSKLKAEKNLFTLGQDSNYILIDFRWSFLSPLTRSFLSQWQSLGYRIILAHPERLFSKKDLPVLKELAEADVYFQLNAGSFSGDYGWKIRRMAKIFLKQGLCHLIASDAHSLYNYRGQLPACRKSISKRLGDKAARILFEDNPELLLAGKPLLSIQ